MQKAPVLLAAATLSGILLLMTGHPAYFLTLFGSSAYFGWTFAKNNHEQTA
jgi:hypothetical protein